jgi:hypothetical protein
VTVRDVKVCRGVEFQFQSFLTSAVDGSGCLASRPPPALSPLTGPSASPRVNMNVLQRRNVSCRDSISEL